jgi:cyclohexanone monooxygenase
MAILKRRTSVSTIEPIKKDPQKLDAIVFGAGFAGLVMQHKLQNKLGLNSRIIEKADGVGGTWYWNRYPGARLKVSSRMFVDSRHPADRAK